MKPNLTRTQKDVIRRMREGATLCMNGDGFFLAHPMQNIDRVALWDAWQLLDARIVRFVERRKNKALFTLTNLGRTLDLGE